MKLRIGAAVLCLLPAMLAFPVGATTTAAVETVPTVEEPVIVVTEPDEIDERIYYYEGTEKRDPTAFEWVSGHTGTAIALGGDRYLRYSSARVLELEEFTFSAWVNWQGGESDQRLLTVYRNENRNLTVSPNAVDADAKLNGVCMTWVDRAIDPVTLYKPVSEGVSTALTTGVWHHVAVVASDTEYSLYIDGTLYLSQAMDTSFADMELNTLIIGGGTDDEPRLNALLDDALLYKQALTAQQIALLAAGMDPADGGTAPTVTEQHATAPPQGTQTQPTDDGGDGTAFPTALVFIPAGVIAVVVILSLLLGAKRPDDEDAAEQVERLSEDEPPAEQYDTEEENA